MKILLLLVVVISCFSCIPTSIEKDLSIICEEALRVNQDTSLSEDKKREEFVYAIFERVSIPKTKDFLNNLAVSPNLYHTEFKHFADENNIKDWSCEALEVLFKNF